MQINDTSITAFMGGPYKHLTQSVIKNKSASKILKSRYKTLFLYLLKSIKRYYLGKTAIKYIAYKILHNKAKSLKWQKRHNERYEHLQKSLKIFMEFQKIYSQSKAWVESQTFKEKYTNHHYPPLLKPDLANYNAISAELAWELNMPLPQIYDFINISSGCSASAASFVFLKECGVHIDSGEFMELYKNSFHKISKGKRALFFYFVMFWGWDKGNAHKFTALLTQKMPLLYIARDPISKIRCIINHIVDMSDEVAKVKNFTLKSDPKMLMPKPKYIYSNASKPDLKYLSNPTQDDLTHLRSSLALDSILEIFKDSVSEILCIEFNDLKPSVAFDTFCRLAKKLHLEKPKNKAIFTNRVWNEIYALLPTTLCVNPRDVDNLADFKKFNIIITLPHYLDESQKDFVDISGEIENNLVIDETRILIIIQKDNLMKLQSNHNLYKQVLIFLRNYINAIISNIAERKANLISEADILEHLSNNKTMRDFIKNTLDSELNYIKVHHPDFLKVWTHYQEFERICTE